MLQLVFRLQVLCLVVVLNWLVCEQVLVMCRLDILQLIDRLQVWGFVFLLVWIELMKLKLLIVGEKQLILLVWVLKVKLENRVFDDVLVLWLWLLVWLIVEKQELGNQLFRCIVLKLLFSLMFVWWFQNWVLLEVVLVLDLRLCFRLKLVFRLLLRFLVLCRLRCELLFCIIVLWLVELIFWFLIVVFRWFYRVMEF